MKIDRLNKMFKYLVFIMFIVFSALYISQSAGYYEYKNSRKVSLTNEQIREFEKDVSSGKNVDLKKYIEINNKGYQNKLSKAGLSVSSSFEKIVQKIIDKSFKVLSKLVGE